MNQSLQELRPDISRLVGVMPHYDPWIFAVGIKQILQG